MENLPIAPVLASQNDVISGSLKCSTATLFSRTSSEAAVVALANPSSVDSVKYALYNMQTGKVLDSGTLSSGNSKQITIPATSEMSTYRLQNQSDCGITHTTPFLMYNIAIEG